MHLIRVVPTRDPPCRLMRHALKSNFIANYFLVCKADPQRRKSEIRSPTKMFPQFWLNLRSMSMKKSISFFQSFASISLSSLGQTCNLALKIFSQNMGWVIHFLEDVKIQTTSNEISLEICITIFRFQKEFLQQRWINILKIQFMNIYFFF